MRPFFSLCAALFLTMTSPFLLALDDAFSGLHIDISEEFEEDFGWREVDMWGSEYMFSDESGRLIEIDVAPRSDENGEDDIFSQLPGGEFDIHMKVKVTPVQKDGLEGNCVEVRANNRTVFRGYQLNDDDFSYAFNFFNLSINEDYPLNFIIEPEGELDFDKDIQKMMNSIHIHR